MANEIATPPLPNFRFAVELVVDDASGLGLSSPLCSAAFSECAGLEASMTTKVIEEGGNNLRQVHLVGPVTYSQLTLKRGMTDSLDLWAWFGAVASRRAPGGARADGSVRVLQADGSPGVTFQLHRCLPVKLKGSALAGTGGTVAVEELTLSYASFALARG